MLIFLPKKKCVCGRNNVRLGETMSLPDTGCPGHKLTSRWSPDMFPASIRIKMTREIHWACQKCPEQMKIHENQFPKKKNAKQISFFLEKNTSM